MDLMAKIALDRDRLLEGISSEKDYCAIAASLLLSPTQAALCFDNPLASWKENHEKELREKRFSNERYCMALYSPENDAFLADAIADLAFAQLTRLQVKAPISKDDDVDQQAVAFVVAVYVVFALMLHGRDDYEALFRHAWYNYVELEGSRSVREVYDAAWNSRYAPDKTYYPL